ncbi:FAD-dependent oxidoreductase [Streptomyces litchfieldiae]|uniref:NAD(P)/FAD-dependent oxidoreductase n=1 Tax=Streptomyces litchfieldiae TaxID=3075543 RepID=A0ABU2MJM5_9ACTN|nr:NAD(P)/FAD-dependent oxidoreductase [Streptomyces sp. DSM 44938]MDT0341309.1 NAD(P)/FAD-dependent oxidoreductase [Streptomyces sp. DSM 44938]
MSADGAGDPRVVVCGAGAGGLAAARALGAAGLRVLVLDKRSRPAPVAKGEVLQPGALRVLGEWGVLSPLVERGTAPLSRIVTRTAEGEPSMVFDYLTLPPGFRSLMSSDHLTILDALGEGLPGHVEIRRGAVAEDLVTDASGRVAGVRVRQGGRRYEERCLLVVAADGMSSRLRQAAGITAEPRAYGHRLVAFELPGAPARPPEVTAYDTPRGLRLVYALPHARTRLYVQVRPDELRGMTWADLVRWGAGLDRDAPALRPLGERVVEALDTRQIFTLRRFIASSLTVPGLVLVGEAAHAVHSLAAQGMNTAIAEAYALVGQLGRSGFDGPAAVDRALLAYEAERMRWTRHIDRMSHDAVRMVTETAWPARTLGRRMLRRTRRSRRLSYIATHNLAGLGIHPFGAWDRLHQVGLPDPRAGRLPRWSGERGAPAPAVTERGGGRT